MHGHGRQALKIDNRECTRCMHCINVMPRALRIGDEKGLSVFAGAKAPILDGAQMGYAARSVHRSQQEAPYTRIKEEVIEPIWDWWMEEGKNRERLGELMKRQGCRRSSKSLVWTRSAHGAGTAYQPVHLLERRRSGRGRERDVNEFRKYHQR
jgi:dissimilatory sulfite reductase alpha subunit